MAWINKLKEENPDIKTMIGGPFFSYLSEFILKKSPITEIDSPKCIPSNFKFKEGIDIPLM